MGAGRTSKERVRREAAWAEPLSAGQGLAESAHSIAERALSAQADPETMMQCKNRMQFECTASGKSPPAAQGAYKYS